MLGYSLLAGYTVLWTVLPVLFDSLSLAVTSGSFQSFSLFFVISSVLLMMILITLTKFSYFHVGLVIKNSTTIETLENSYNGRYSISFHRNFTQVFGNSPIWWIFPFYFQSGMPEGDGINWSMVGNLSLSSEINVESEPNVKEIKMKKTVERSEKLIENSKSPVDSETDTSFIRNNLNVSN